jgi:hypothetical protein
VKILILIAVFAASSAFYFLHYCVIFFGIIIK